MKKNLLSLSVLLTGIALASCQKENVIQPQENGPEKKHFEVTFNEEENARMILLRGDYTVSEAELLNQAKSFAKSLTTDETQTKGKTVSRVPVLVDSLVEVKSIATKSGAGPQEAKVYVVSFGKEAGYAFFAGDKRAGGLLGFVGEGDFDADTDNPGLRFTYGCMTQYVATEVERMEALRGDALYTEMAEKYAPLVSDKPQTKVYMPVFNGIEWIWTEVDYSETLPEEHIYGYETIIPELLKCYWGQDWPYNYYVTKIYSQPTKEVPAGCTATAMAQIMNYHKHPGGYGGTIFLWGLYRNFLSEWYQLKEKPGETVNTVVLNVGMLLFHLGGSANLNINYDSGGSSAQSSNVPRTFTNFLYNSSKLIGYNTSTAISNIGKGRPVYLRGESASGEGHAWVGDGTAYWSDTIVRKTVYYYQGHEVGYDIQKGAIGGRNFIHCNWGWDDRRSADVGNNAWMLSNVFKPIGTDRDYSHDCGMIADIYPN